MVPKMYTRWLWLAFLLFWCTGFGSAKELYFTGATMGTTYHIKVVAEPNKSHKDLQQHIDRRLKQLNKSMSTFQSDSEISRFNRLQSIGTDFPVSQDFLHVMLAADAVYRLTDGAWDGTVKPLVDLWGFGPAGSIHQVPSDEAIAAALKKVGFQKIEVSAKGFLRKHQPAVTIDLASIAKGYGVDQVSEVIEEAGFRNYLVEIGGEVYAAGKRPDGKQWRVGINRPLKTATANAVYKALELQDQAMATSGDYRNFEVIGGHAYSHIIDPRTGYPVNKGVVSTSVVAPNCTLADGLATALMVMGPVKGIALLNRINAVEGLIVVQKADGVLENHWSRGFEDQSP
jgi:thiamine biosynthesis lipoprotein